MKWWVVLLGGALFGMGCASSRPVVGRAQFQCFLTKQGQAKDCHLKHREGTVTEEKAAELLHKVESEDHSQLLQLYKMSGIPYTFNFEFRDPDPSLVADAGT